LKFHKEYALIDPNLIEEKITEKTKAVLVTHLFGNPCDMDQILEVCKRRNIYLLEDCAHAFKSEYKGKSLGSFGDAAIFSTSPMKVPTTIGGGFVVIKDEKIYEKIRNDLYSNEEYRFHLKDLYKLFIFSLVYYLNSFPWVFSILTSSVLKYLKTKNPGQLRKLFYSELISTKKFDPFERIRFTNLQAKVGISQIKRFDEMTAVRKKYAKIYEEYFSTSDSIKMIKEKEGGVNNYLYDIAVLTNDCSQFIDDAMKNGVFLMREDCWNCNNYDFSKDFVSNAPVADNLQPKLVRLPNSSLLKEKQIHDIARKLLHIVK